MSLLRQAGKLSAPFPHGTDHMAFAVVPCPEGFDARGAEACDPEKARCPAWAGWGWLKTQEGALELEKTPGRPLHCIVVA